MGKYGLASTNSNSSATTPSVTFSGSSAVIENCSGAGVYVNSGTVTIKAGSIDHNFIGVDMESNGVDTPSVTLYDTVTPATNTTVICNSNQENASTNPGIDVYNDSTGNVAADYVNWDQWYTPSGTTTATTDEFWCDNSTFSCTCEVFDSTSAAACVNMGTNDYDLVLGTSTGNNPPAQTATFTNGAQAANPCN
jgi:hypothetical protein